jgi:ketosteroid isomerase-like protein
MIAVVVITACQQTPKTIPVDIEGEKDAVAAILDKYYSAINEQDVATLTSYLTEDVLCCGSDPSEFWNKQQITDEWTQMFADSTFEISFIIDKQEIKVAPDGNSAIVVDQYMLPTFIPKIPCRNVSYLVKTNDKWMILFLSFNLIPKNEDLPKLNEALD